MTEFRLVRQFNGKTSTSESKAYRVETTALMTEQEAMQLMRDLGSPYQGQKYEAAAFPATEWGTDAWGKVMSEPSEEHARKVVHTFRGKLFKRAPMGQWELVEA